MLSLKNRLRSSESRLAASALAFALVALTGVSNARAASTATPSQPGIGEDVVLDNVPARDGLTNNTGDEAVAEQIFQSEFASARSVASFARDAKKLGLLANDTFTSLFPAGALETGPMGLSGRGLFNTISALHSPRVTPGSLSSISGQGSGATGKSASDEALSQFWEQTASADFAFNFSDSTSGAAASPGPANVLIPLPAAAWSALSVLAAMAAAKAMRRRSGR